MKSKIAVVYYSLEGNTHWVAEQIAQQTGADLIRLKPVKDVKQKGFSKFIWGGKQVVFKEKPQLEAYENLDVYDTVIIGSPIWASTMAPAISTMLNKEKWTQKKCALYCCCSGGSGKYFDQLKASLQGNTIIGERTFIDPLKQRDIASNTINEWINSMDLSIK